MSGKLIVIEGLDGSGKATQTALLYESMRAQGDNVFTLSFPCYDDESSALVRMYLGGEFGEKPGDVNGYAASVFFAVDRYASFKKNWQRDYAAGGLFLCDRYTTSNAVYQAGKLPRERWENYLEWLFDFEYNKMGIPKPDVVFYLDISPETSRALTEKRYGGDESRKDIHERDIEFQRISREAALYCAELQGWRIIRCDKDGTMRSIEDVHNDLMQQLKEAAF